MCISYLIGVHLLGVHLTSVRIRAWVFKLHPALLNASSRIYLWPEFPVESTYPESFRPCPAVPASPKSRDVLFRIWYVSSLCIGEKGNNEAVLSIHMFGQGLGALICRSEVCVGAVGHWDTCANTGSDAKLAHCHTPCPPSHSLPTAT